MIGEVVRALRCPTCAQPFGVSDTALRCTHGHTFDIARQGYANLLTGRAPAGAETAGMVAARAELLAAGHLDPVARAVVAQARARSAGSSGHGLVVDVGAGTGYYLAAVLDALPAHHGLALDVAKAAVRRAARAHPRAAAVVADAWHGLPLADGCADLVLDIFAPRNGAEFRRVLRPGGTLLVVTPQPDHLAELVGPLGLIGVDPDKGERLDRSLGGHLTLVDEQRYRYPLALRRDEAARFVAMGPSAWHAEPDALAARLAGWAEPVRVTVSVSVRVYGVGGGGVPGGG
jgi:23S rRNA (guanine745-N1)-methyltransferase